MRVHDMKNTAPGPSVARKTEVDWGSLVQPPVEEWKPTTPEERAAEQQRRWQEKFEQELAEEGYHDTVDAMVIRFEGAPEVAAEDMVPLDQMVQAARRARQQGASRLCMGAAWREVPRRLDFDRVAEMVEA